MNRDMLSNPLTLPIRKGVGSYLRGLMVCLPGKVVAFDSDRQSAQVECGIQRQINGEWQTIPVIHDVRVNFPGDNEWYMWHQVKPGTEGLIHFSQRAIDTWMDQGGPVAPHEIRMFSAEDAFFVPGIRSNPRLIPGFVNEGVGMSSYDGQTRVHLSPGMIDLKAATINLDADTINETSSAHNITSAALAIDANTGITGTMHNNGTNVGSTHTHPQANDSGGDSEQDTGAPK